MTNKYYLFLLLALLSFAGCQKFEDLQLDPNRATEVGPDQLLTNLQTNLTGQINMNATLASRFMVFTDGSSLYQYYGWQRDDFSDYEQLRQVHQMEEEAMRVENENYLALSKFFRTFIIINLTQRFGDVPYMEAMSGFEDNFSPAYTPQQEIYADVLEQLEEANNMLSEENGSIEGDLIYDGNVEQWKKAINSFKLRVLMSLSNKTGGSINIQEQFQQIVSSPAQYPIMTSNEDNMALNFYNREENRYPYFNDNGIQTAYYLDNSYVHLLKDRNDPRLYAIGGPDFNSRENNVDPMSQEAYSGLGGSANLSDNITLLNQGLGSPINSRYYTDPVNEPVVALGYAELAFTVAEAAQRGWVSADAATYYQQGIQASMEFYGVGEGEIAAYVAQPLVAYSQADGLEQILTQKYMAFFFKSGWEPFFNQRRTGIPEFSTSGGGILNNGQVPVRWMYPQDELNLNNANVSEAISRQFGSDNINGVMWLLDAN